MTITSCGNCGQKLVVPPERLGKRAKCGRCGQIFLVSPDGVDEIASGPRVAPAVPPVSSVKAPRSIWVAGAVGAVVMLAAGFTLTWFVATRSGTEHLVSSDLSREPSTAGAGEAERSTSTVEPPQRAVAAGDAIAEKPPLGRDKPKAGLPGANGPLFENVGKEGPKVTGADVGPGVNDPKPDSPPANRKLPSGLEKLFFAVKFQSKPQGASIAFDIYDNNGVVETGSGVVLQVEDNATGEYTLKMARSARAGKFGDGPYQARIKVDEKVVALVNWFIGQSDSSASDTGRPVQTGQPPTSGVTAREPASPKTPLGQKLQDLGSVTESRRFEVAKGSSAAFTDDGKRVVSVSGELELFEFEVATGEKVRHQPAQDQHTLIATTTDYRFGLSICRPKPNVLGQIHVWDFVSGRGVRSWPEPDGAWETYRPEAGLSPDAALAVTLYEEPAIRSLPGGGLSIGGGKSEAFVWDCQSGTVIRPTSVRAYGTIAFSPDGQWIVADDSQKNVTIWDAKTGKSVRKLNGTPARLSRLLVSADRKYVVAACHDDKKYPIVIWDATTGELLHTLNTQSTSVRGLAFSPDDRNLLCAERGDSEKMIAPTFRLWDVATGRQLGSFVAQNVSDVYDVAFSPDGSSFVSAGEASRMRILQVWSSVK